MAAGIEAHRWMMAEVNRPMVREAFVATPDRDEVVVAIAGCGVCHTDLGYLYDGVRTNHPLPLALTGVADDPEAAALSYFDRHLAPKSARSLRFATRAARHGATARLTEKLAAVETIYLEELMATQDALEGLSAFLEKRPARWKDL